MSRHQKKRGVENKLLLVLLFVVCCCSLWKKNDDDATEGAKKERRNRNREETGTRKRRRTRPSRGRVGGVFSREERKGFALLFFIFSSSPNFPSLLLNAHCVLLRETIARTLPLWEEHRRRPLRWVPGGRKTLREAGERDERRGTEWSRRSDGDDGHRG